MVSFRFCETDLLHIKPFVVNKSAISPFLGGISTCSFIFPGGIWKMLLCPSLLLLLLLCSILMLLLDLL